MGRKRKSAAAAWFRLALEADGRLVLHIARDKKKRMALFDEQGGRIKGLAKKLAAEQALAKIKVGIADNGRFHSRSGMDCCPRLFRLHPVLRTGSSQRDCHGRALTQYEVVAQRPLCVLRRLASFAAQGAHHDLD